MTLRDKLSKNLIELLNCSELIVKVQNYSTNINQACQ